MQDWFLQVCKDLSWPDNHGGKCWFPTSGNTEETNDNLLGFESFPSNSHYTLYSGNPVLLTRLPCKYWKSKYWNWIAWNSNGVSPDVSCIPHLGNLRYHMDLLSITEYLLLNEYHWVFLTVRKCTIFSIWLLFLLNASRRKVSHTDIHVSLTVLTSIC